MRRPGALRSRAFHLDIDSAGVLRQLSFVCERPDPIVHDLWLNIS